MEARVSERPWAATLQRSTIGIHAAAPELWLNKCWTVRPGETPLSTSDTGMLKSNSPRPTIDIAIGVVAKTLVSEAKSHAVLSDAARGVGLNSARPIVLR
jgi:hypothetical protein